MFTKFSSSFIKQSSRNFAKPAKGAKPAAGGPPAATSSAPPPLSAEITPSIDHYDR